MKYVITAAFFLLVSLAHSQDNSTDYYADQSQRWFNSNCDTTNQHYLFNGKDPLGADVLVVYNKDFDKVYQERSIEGITTYAQYANRRLVKFGRMESNGGQVSFAP